MPAFKKSNSKASGATTCLQRHLQQGPGKQQHTRRVISKDSSRKRHQPLLQPFLQRDVRKGSGGYEVKASAYGKRREKRSNENLEKTRFPSHAMTLPFCNPPSELKNFTYSRTSSVGPSDSSNWEGVILLDAIAKRLAGTKHPQAAQAPLQN